MIYLDELVIEVTRRCNMQCRHCLRGDTQIIDIAVEHVRQVFTQINGIGTITFSGGEPSLATATIHEILKLAETYNLPVDNFYCATNGYDISDKFVLEMLRWYSYCDDNEISSVDISDDEYHDNGGDVEDGLLNALSFVHRKGTMGSDSFLLNQGRALELDTNRQPTYDPIDLENNNVSGLLYLNACGQIIDGCDWSYDEQPNHIICKADDDIEKVLLALMVRQEAV